MNKVLFYKIENYMKACVKETAGDKEHIYRVLGNCIKFASNETCVDYDILLAAALLHDIGRDGKKKKHNERGVEMAREYLCSVEFSADKIGAVCHAILTHNNESYGKQKLLKQRSFMMPIRWTMSEQLA